VRSVVFCLLQQALRPTFEAVPTPVSPLSVPIPIVIDPPAPGPDWVTSPFDLRSSRTVTKSAASIRANDGPAIFTWTSTARRAARHPLCPALRTN